MQPQTPKYTEWLAAEKDAQAAERELHAEMLRAARGISTSRLASLALIARAKRAQAHSLFDAAMQELKSLAESLHHGRIDPRPAPSSGEADRQR